MAKKKYETELDKLQSQLFDCMMQLTYICQDIKKLEDGRNEILATIEGLDSMIELAEAKRDGVRIN